MKSSKLLNTGLALSVIGTVDIHPSSYRLKSHFSDAVLKDVQEIRQIRQYASNSPQANADYDAKVVKITDCFAETQPVSAQWNETQAILDIHACALQNNYPNIVKLDDKWGESVKKIALKGVVFADHLRKPEEVNIYTTHSTQADYKKFKLTESGAIFERKIIDSPTATPLLHISIDNHSVAIANPYPNPHFNMIFIAHTSVIQTPFSKENLDNSAQKLQYRNTLNKSNHVTLKHIDSLANKILDGNFKDQKHAVNLLLEYKILSSLLYSIEESKGTQFNNIVKFNYLTEAIKEKYPAKIDSHLNIPHIIDDKNLDHAPFLKNPEIAVTMLAPHQFKTIQRKQITKEFEKTPN